MGLGIIALIVGGVVGYLEYSGVSVSEVAELIAEGGENQLREQMRPASSGPRVLVIALDGVGDDELRDAVAGGRAPNMARLLGASTGENGVYEHAYAVPGVLSVLPSTTLAAWSSVFTGRPAGQHGVPGNEWFAREEGRFYAPAPVSITEAGDAVKVYAEDLIGGALRAPTLYERANVRSHVSLSQIHHGADILTTPDVEAFGALASALAEGITDEEEVTQAAYEELDRTAVESLIGSLQKHGIPDLQVVYFPGVDLYTHVAEQPIDDQRNYLRDVVDDCVGLILAEYQAQGFLEETYVVFVSDHGHTPVLDDDRHALGAEGEDEPTSLIQQAGFRLRPLKIELAEEEQDYQATVAYQGAIAYVYLADRSTCAAEGQRCDWKRAPRLQEDVIPVARAFAAATATGAGVPALQGTLDLIFAREPRASGQDALPFQVWDGERLVPVGEYLSANPRPDLLDLQARLDSLAVGPYGHRAGDILLLAKSGPDRPIEERFYFSGRYRSWHGSPSSQDSEIPLVVARPSSSGADLRDRISAAVGDKPSQLDITDVLLSLLNPT